MIRGPYALDVRARRAARTRTLLHAAVLRELARRGYHRLRLADVARRAHVATRTIYLHAPSREALVRDALRARADALRGDVERWRPRSDAPEAILEELVAFHDGSYRAEKILLETLVDGGVPDGAPMLRALDAERLKLITRTVGDLARRNTLRVRAADATALAHALLAYPTWRVAVTGPAGRRARRLIASTLRSYVLAPQGIA